MRYTARLAITATAAALLVQVLGFVGDALVPSQGNGSARAEIVVPGSRSTLGAYLAGRAARYANDNRNAAVYLRAALERDPQNVQLTEQVFLIELTDGNWSEARGLAQSLSKAGGEASDTTRRLAHLFLGVEAFKGGDWATAEREFKSSAGSPVSDLTATIARAWTKVAEGKSGEGVDLLAAGNPPEWAQLYLRYHRGLAADMSGRRADARSSFEKAFKSEARTLRVALAFARHAANSGDMRLAKSIIRDHLDKSGGEGHPSARALRDMLVDGADVALIISTPAEGLSEMLYGLGEALTAEGGVGIGTIYLQLALALAPSSDFALAALANVYETTKHHDRALETYARMPASSSMMPAVEVRKALNLNLLEKPDEAREVLEKLAADRPTDLAPLDALGGIMRAQKRWSDAVDYYTRAIALIPKPQKKDWVYWYNRGTSFERLKQWPRAEADLLKALQLAPDQPLVLNYLGYSWIDQNMNLKKGLQLIEKAVELKPDDGYIVDSLGWAHYKLGNYAEAVKYLERAVELRPEDPTLNDHLGDALWRVGREREARYQWEQALSLKAEPEDAEKITAKLQNGLPAIKTAARPLRRGRPVVQQPGAPRRVGTSVEPGSRVR